MKKGVVCRSLLSCGFSAPVCRSLSLSSVLGSCHPHCLASFEQSDTVTFFHPPDHKPLSPLSSRRIDDRGCYETPRCHHARFGPRPPSQREQQRQQPLPRPRLRRPPHRQPAKPLRRRRRRRLCPAASHLLEPPRLQHNQHAVPPLIHLLHGRHPLGPINTLHRPTHLPLGPTHLPLGPAHLPLGPPPLVPRPPRLAPLAAAAAARVVPGLRGGRSLLHLVPPRGLAEGVGRRAARLQRPVPDAPALRVSGHPVSLLSLPLPYLEGAEDPGAEASGQECGRCGGECQEVWA